MNPIRLKFENAIRCRLPYLLRALRCQLTRSTGFIAAVLILLTLISFGPMASAQDAADGFASTIQVELTEQELTPVDLSASSLAPEIAIPQPSVEFGVNVQAKSVDKWKQGQWDVFHLQDDVRITQGNVTLAADFGVIWVQNQPASQNPTSIVLYLEDSVAIDIGQDGPAHSATGSNSNRFTDVSWFGRLRTVGTVQFENFVQEISSDNAPEIFQRGMDRRQQELDSFQEVQFVAPQTTTTVISPVTGQVQQVFVPTTQVAPAVLQNTMQDANGQSVLQPYQSAIGQQQGLQQNGAISPGPMRIPAGGIQTTDVQILPRNPSMGGNLQVKTNPNSDERILISTGGTRVNIDSSELNRVDQMGQPATSRLVIQADNVVAWENPTINPDGTSGSRYEVYLEGNVIFAQGNRVIYADRMYYDATARRGTILNADVLTPVPSYNGLLRLKADVVQQLNDDQFQAFGAAITSSRLGVPRYWLQSDQINLTRQRQPTFDPVTGFPIIDPATGGQPAAPDYVANSQSNTVYIGGIPIFYWPNLRTDLNNPSYYIERVRVGNDSIFGFQAGIGLDLYQIFGIQNRPANGRWVGNFDYLSERGFGFGTDLDYRSSSFFGVPGNVDGYLRAWFINDSGLDNLGRDRRQVPLEEDFRGRILGRHRHTFAPGYKLRAEVGYLSDQNFLPSYYEREWDQEKDYTTGLWLERNISNQSFNLIGDIRLNDFYTQTDWLPRLDHFIIGQPVLFDRAVWHAHSTAGYARFRTANAPTNAIDLAKFDPLAWEGADREGMVAGTRHEIDFPIQIGATKVVPYVLGDASFWKEDLNGDDVSRLYGQAGVRASLPFWRADPTIHSTLFNLNGLAHKVSWDSEFLVADSNQDMDRLPLYNQLDDDSQEFFRRRFAFDTFGIMGGMGQNTPLKYDERFFALRSGLQSSVTTPSMEIADDLMMVRTGFRNRWQTKRGLPGEARIIDWITFDISGNFYPDADRDNFGSDFGVVDYDFTWHVGDRLSLVSDGYFDFFGQGLRTASFGAHMSRPGVGNLYMGFRSIEGPISSNVLSASATYRMSDKWIIRGNSTVDFQEAGSIGQSLGFVRVGESFLVQFGVNADISRDNVGFVFSVEPRFLQRGALGLVGGQRIPPASTNYLE